MNFRYRLMQFMSGRRGPDELFFILFSISVVLSFINVFITSIIIQIFVYALMLYAIYRMLSRNLTARARENSFIMDKVRFISNKKSFYHQKKADQCHVYKKCPSCKAILRLPRRVGVHKTACPKCGTEFTVKVKK